MGLPQLIMHPQQAELLVPLTIPGHFTAVALMPLVSGVWVSFHHLGSAPQSAASLFLTLVPILPQFFEPFPSDHSSPHL